MKRIALLIVIAASLFMGGIALGSTLPEGTTDHAARFEDTAAQVKLGAAKVWFKDREAIGEYVALVAKHIGPGDRWQMTLVLRGEKRS